MAFKRMKPVRPAASAPVDSQLHAELRRAVGLKERGRRAEAREIAENLKRRYPSRKEPHLLLLDLAILDKDMVAFEDAIEPLLKLAPNDPEFALEHARAAASNGLLALALERFKRFLERWPQHKEAPGLRKIVPELEEELGRIEDESGFHYPNRFELAARNDEIQSLIMRQRFDAAQALARQTLERVPTYPPILNNMAMLLMLDGKWQEALTYSERVLEANPENVYALANLARGNYILGYKEEATIYARRMKAGSAGVADKTGKVIETLSYLGDDEGVLDAYRQALTDKDDPSLEAALTHHLAGAAAMRLGQEEDARRYWKEALRVQPGFDMTRETLADLKRPVGERHAPWPFSFQYWMPKSILTQLAAELQHQAQLGKEEATEGALRSILQRYPYLETLAPVLLERGDLAGREFALYVARFAKTPAMLAALRDFALSQHGPDKMRIEAANIAAAAGLLESGPARLWVEGAWKDVQLMGWEIHSEIKGHHAPRVEGLVADGTMAMYSGDGVRAERLLKKALEIEPNAPDILNNLANTYKLQGRDSEAKQLAIEIAERFPDYFFGTINMVQVNLEEGKLEEAERLLAPIASLKRYHFSEFAALAQCQIELALKKHEPESARSWYDMWKQTSPDHPGLEHYRKTFDSPTQGAVRRTFTRSRPY